MNTRILLIVIVSGLHLAAAPQSSITRYGITWHFDKAYEAGRFVNGDWWVQPGSPAGTVTVDSVTPGPGIAVGGSRINGSMVNPMPRPGQACQAFDERSNQYDAALEATYPVTLSADQSLASAVCYDDGDSRPSWLFLKYIGVLTCLADAPESTDFRPSYVGTTKTVYSSIGLRTDLLPGLPAVGNTPDLPTLAEARFSRPWIDFPYQWSANNIRSSYESNYGREKAVDVGGAGLLLALDENDVGDKTPLLHGMIQVGIDLYHTLQSGGGWPPNGGHLMGRKFPILFAGLMLDNSGMLAVGRDYPACSGTFHEDDMAFIVTDEDTALQLLCMVGDTAVSATDTSIDVVGYPGGVPRYVRLAGNYIIITDGPGAGQERYITSDNCGWGTPPATVHLTVDPPWETVPVAGQSVYRVPGYRARHLGKAEWNANACSNKLTANPSYFQPYRQINLWAWPGEVLAARIFGLQEAWNQEAVFQVIDEYMLIDIQPGGEYEGDGCWSTGGNPPPSDSPNYGISGSFIENMWETYRADFGCVLTGIDTIAHQAVYDCGSTFVAGRAPQLPAGAFTVFPNPVKDILFIRQETVSGLSPVIYDRTGAIRYRFPRTTKTLPVLQWDGYDLTGKRVEPGLYFVGTGGLVREVMVID